MKATFPGVYLLRAPSGACYVGMSYNVKGTLKRLRFELSLNASPYTAVQRLWNAFGRLDMEVLEEWEEEANTSSEQEARLKERLLCYQQKFNAEVLQPEQLK